MKKTLLSLTIFIISIWGGFSEVAFADCPQFHAFGKPVINVKDTVYELCRTEYAVEYSARLKTSYWSATVITREKALGKLKRDDAFLADPDLPIKHRATPTDYEGTGYDKGHLTAFKDVGDNAKAGRETFLMSNMIPQVPGNNRNGWRLLENYVRELAISRGELFVTTGPVYFESVIKHIGKSGVAVPDAIYKIILDKKTRSIIVFVVPNRSITVKDLPEFLTDLTTVEKLTGLSFFPSIPPHYTVSTTMWTGATN